MSGITMKELCDYISQGHEVEFTYNNEKYVPDYRKIYENEYNDITHEIVGTTFNQYCGYNKEPYQNCLAFSFDLG